MRRRRSRALLCHLLVVSQCLWTLGCSQDSIDTGGSRATSVAGVLAAQDLGAVAFRLYRQSIADEPAGPSRDARLATLDAHRDAFVRAVNDVVNVRTLQGVTQTADALFALVDDGTLPTLALHAADALERLANDGRATAALVRLLRSSSHAHPPLPAREVLQLLGRMFNYSETERLWQATAQLVADNDGVDDQGQPNGEPTLVQDLLALAQDLLLQVPAPGQPSSGRLAAALDELTEALTEEAVIRGSFDFGPAEWVARVDDRGAPRVAVDPATGRVYAPFVDSDGDGLADLDPSGRFVDAQGAPIDLPTFGDANAPGYDVTGRAVAGSGAPLYEYVDAKRTHLAIHLALVGQLLARGAERPALAVLEAALGQPTAPGAGGGYDPDGPLADLGWGALALFEPDAAPAMVRAGREVLQRDPALAERVVVALSRALEASAQAHQQAGAGRRLSDPAVIQLTDDLLPLADDLLEQPSGSSTSTARHLMDVLADLGATAPDFPYQLAPLFTFREVAREQVPDADRNTIDEQASLPVDPSQPAWVGQQDNRSAVHRLLDLLARVNGCSFFGQNLAVLVLDTMAGLSPSTVSGLVSILNAMPGFLTNLVCSGVSQDLSSLDALAKSGALDAFLPIAKAFKDRGEVELLVRLLVRVQQDYDPVLRPYEGDLALLLESGALDAAFEAIDLSRGVHDPVTGHSAVDLAAAALERLVDDDAVILDARGAQVPSRAHLLLEPLRELDRRVVAAGREAELEALADALFAVFLQRVQVSGQEQLKNGGLIPLAARGLEALAAALPADPADRAREVAAAQQALRDAAASPHLVTALSVVRTIDAAPSRGLIHQGLVDLLTPQRTTPEDIFGGVVKVSVILLQQPPDPGAMADLAPYLADVLDPTDPLVPDSVRAFERLLTADSGRTVLNLLRAALNPAPGETRSPAEVLLSVVEAVEAARVGGVALDAAGVTDALRGLVAFIRDDQAGLGWVFQLIRDRRVAP